MSIGEIREIANDLLVRPLWVMTTSPGAATTPSRKYRLPPFVSLVAVRGVWFLLDYTPMLFLGDSESYIATAVRGWIPSCPERRRRPRRRRRYAVRLRASISC